MPQKEPLYTETQSAITYRSKDIEIAVCSGECGVEKKYTNLALENILKIATTEAQPSGETLPHSVIVVVSDTDINPHETTDELDERVIPMAQSETTVCVFLAFLTEGESIYHTMMNTINAYNNNFHTVIVYRGRCPRKDHYTYTGELFRKKY